MKAHELLSDKAKWIQGTFARNSLGKPVVAASHDAMCWCADGALIRCYGADPAAYWEAMHRARDVAERKHGMGFVQVNDELGYDAVLAVLREADV